jgi:hypothetical protein
MTVSMGWKAEFPTDSDCFAPDSGRRWVTACRGNYDRLQTLGNKKLAAYAAGFSRFPVSSRTLRRVPDRRGVGTFLLGCWSVLGDLGTEPEAIIDIPRRCGDL